MTPDRYRYFRLEAVELLEGLTRRVLEIDRGNASKDLFADALRLAHTLKGAASVVKLDEMARSAHEMEDHLATLEGLDGESLKQQIDRMLEQLDGMRDVVASLEQDAEAIDRTPSNAASVLEEPRKEKLETLRVGVAEMKQFVADLTAAQIQAEAVRRLASGFEGIAATFAERLRAPRWRDEARSEAVVRAGAEVLEAVDEIWPRLSRAEGRLRRELRTACARANRLTLVPVATLFADLEQASRETARSLSKEVIIEMDAGDARLEAHVLSSLRGPLMHLIRNAIDHGIESPSTRERRGKPRSGRIELKASRRLQTVVFTCRDDGGGIDLDSIRNAASRRGLVSAEEAMSLDVDAALNLIFEPGMTTMESADLTSGRGVGLDVVRAEAGRLRGRVRARSEPGQGTAIEVEVPISLTSIDTLVVDCGGTRTSLPLGSIKRALWLDHREITGSKEGGTVLHEGEAIPFRMLGAFLGAPQSGNGRTPSRSVVICEAEAGVAAFGLDRLLGTRTEIIEPLPRLAGDIPGVLGASFDAEGNAHLVLDPESLVAWAGSAEGHRTAADAPVADPILVIDDSLTTRMLEQTILEANGFEVGVATSGEEGWRMAHERRYGLILVDVEMPGMSGFEFIQRARSDPELRDIPAVLLTTRGSAEDRRRGLEVGARAHLVKSEFNETILLETIRGLLG